MEVIRSVSYVTTNESVKQAVLFGDKMEAHQDQVNQTIAQDGRNAVGTRTTVTTILERIVIVTEIQWASI